MVACNAAYSKAYSYKEHLAHSLDYMLDLQDTPTLAQRTLVVRWSTGVLDLEETLQPPDLEGALSDEDPHLEDAPPLDAGVRALGSVTVRALADDNVALLILDLGEKLVELFYCQHC